MKNLVCAVIACVAVVTLPGVAFAQLAGDPIESYCTTLGPDDHFASDGYALDNAAAIIRQDRANYHAFGVRDESDENDSFFELKDNRARLEAMLRDGNISRAAERAIVDGTPDVCLDIYEDYIDVTVL